jgi:hypothetical protein
MTYVYQLTEHFEGSRLLTLDKPYFSTVCVQNNFSTVIGRLPSGDLGQCNYDYQYISWGGQDKDDFLVACNGLVLELSHYEEVIVVVESCNIFLNHAISSFSEIDYYKEKNKTKVKRVCYLDAVSPSIKTWSMYQFTTWYVERFGRLNSLGVNSNLLKCENISQNSNKFIK